MFPNSSESVYSSQMYAKTSNVTFDSKTIGFFWSDINVLSLTPSALCIIAHNNRFLEYYSGTHSFSITKRSKDIYERHYYSYGVSRRKNSRIPAIKQSNLLQNQKNKSFQILQQTLRNSSIYLPINTSRHFCIFQKKKTNFRVITPDLNQKRAYGPPSHGH